MLLIILELVAGRGTQKNPAAEFGGLGILGFSPDRSTVSLYGTSPAEITNPNPFHFLYSVGSHEQRDHYVCFEWSWKPASCRAVASSSHFISESLAQS